MMGWGRDHGTGVEGDGAAGRDRRGGAVPCAILLGRALCSQLFGVSAADPLTLAGVVLLMGVVGIMAALLPARRAANVEPMEALRAE
jgi:ABC-type antimicrobial peptide transport system permease subunit